MPLPAIEGWSLSNNAEADWESMDDWVANAAKEDVDSWYLCSVSVSCACAFERGVDVSVNMKRWGR